MTLSVTVSETIRVKDVLSAIKRVVRFIVNFFLEEEDQVEDNEPETEGGLSPPTLGISVSDGVGTGEALG